MLSEQIQLNIIGSYQVKIPQRLQRFHKSNFYSPKQSISGRFSKDPRGLKRDQNN